MREYHRTARSGFNQSIDDSEKSGLIHTPISMARLRQITFRKQAALKLEKIIDEQGEEDELCQDSLDIALQPVNSVDDAE